ncbi:DUF835 domain-containing protein [Archaeoglobus profundus]|uniref:Uncharacterized protein n=1 Tax=Archaeoglobus profundus (strain DSM 5631 / JCM 9629 / NBRC 100127 / Av18) TaxID=572546 RepID=D2RH65_ARCPA|nr:DUF835 domain-containing protein [Archaeoglobus profundus]ADB57640.1 hypothetical protein Arcpr_0575 [Archaeoglobus profundus DSM 5631]
MKLVEPLDKLIEDFLRGEFVLVEYDSICHFPLLPLRLAIENDGILVEMGDKLSVKIPALIKFIRNYEGLYKVKIVNISNYKLELEGIYIYNIALAELLSVTSKLYEFFKDYSSELIVFDGVEYLFLHYDLKNVIKDLAGLKVMFPDTTMILFVNYGVVKRRYITLLESLATTTIRFKGVLGDKIVRQGYVLKSLTKPRAETVVL